MKKPHKILLSYALICLVFSGLLLTVLQPRVSAADPNDMNTGRIIDDRVFFDPNGLSISEIQNFLNSKVPTCDTNGTQIHDGSQTRAQYSASRGYYPPFTCLKDYIQQTTSEPADAYCNGYLPVRKTAAEIVYGVAQSCGVNPRVLLVLLQKEQGLVTDSWPWGSQYRSATGYGCPDTAACDSQYYGFFNQVYNAARQYKYYARNTDTFTYKASRNNFIKWNPNDGCGGSTLYIENQATAGLYNYTPYRPNTAALNAGYGTGDSCSAYGNRNFWLYYTDWFGDTFSPNYWWQFDSQASYEDASKSTPLDLSTVVAGTKAYLTVRVKNYGAATWYKNTVNLGTSQPQNRSSSFYDPSWLTGNRAATLQEDSVAPGQYGTFNFWVKVPSTAGSYKEYFNLVDEGVTWMNDMGMNFQFNVQPAKYTWQYQGQGSYTDSTKATTTDLASAIPGKRYYLTTQFKNTGNVTWARGSLNLGTSGPQNRPSDLYDTTWPAPTRAATLDQATVAPGATGSFSFWITAPLNKGGNYKEYFTPVADGVTWLPDYGLFWQVVTPASQYAWQYISQGVYTDAGMATAVNPASLAANTRYYAAVQLRNNGNGVWHQGVLNLGTSSPQNRSSQFNDPTWVARDRPATLSTPAIDPGDTTTIGYWIKTPSVTGTYKEYFTPVADGITWLTDYGMYWQLTVN